MAEGTRSDTATTPRESDLHRKEADRPSDGARPMEEEALLTGEVNPRTEQANLRTKAVRHLTAADNKPIAKAMAHKDLESRLREPGRRWKEENSTEAARKNSFFYF